MEIDISRNTLDSTLIVRTKDFGMYAVRKEAIPVVILKSGYFNGDRDPPIQDVVEVINHFNHIWVMHYDKKYGYPNAYLENKCGSMIEDHKFEKVFHKDEIKKLSLEPWRFSDWRNDRGIYVIKDPKKTILGWTGAYLDDKFK